MLLYSYEDLTKKAYQFILTLQFEKDEKNNYSMKSRGKVRNLANALNEYDDAVTALNKFTEYYRASLTHGGAAITFKEFLMQIDDSSNNSSLAFIVKNPRYDPEKKRLTIQYILGYTNWGAEGICSIFSAYPNDDQKVKEKLKQMIRAEFAVIGGANPEYEDKLVKHLFNLKLNADENSKQRENHV